MAELDWLEQLKQQYPQMAGLLGSIEPTEKDRKHALTNSLLTAGLGILSANDGRSNPFAAVGRGGLMGVQAYQGSIDSQRKDNMQRLQGLGGLLSLGQGLQKNAMWQELMGGGKQQQPSDYAPGENPAPYTGSAPAPSGGGLPSQVQGMVSDLQRKGVDPFIIRANLANGMSDGFKGITDLWMKASELKTGPGPAINPLTGQVQGGVMGGSVLSRGADGLQATPIGGLSQQEAAAAGMKAGATKAAELGAALPLTTAEVPMSNGQKRLMTGQGALQVAQGGQSDIPPELVKAYQDAVRSGQPNFKIDYRIPQGQVGVTQSPAEQAAAVKAATSPIESEQAYTGELQKQNLGFRKDIIDSARTSQQNLSLTSRFMSLNERPGVASGALAEKMSGFKNLADSFGVSVDGVGAEQGMQSIANQMALQLRNPSGGAGMPGALSDSDRKFLVSMTPGMTQTKEGRAVVAETFSAINKRNLEVQDMLLRHEMNGGKLDSAFMKQLADYADKNPLFTEAEKKKAAASESPAQPKVQGATLQFHIQNIMKNGSEADKQKLRAAGYVQ